MKTNNFFDGNVTSISIEKSGKRATIGAVAPGEYSFTTSEPEEMRILMGVLQVALPGRSDFADYPAGETFYVPAGQTFRIRTTEYSAYLCIFG